MIHVKTASKLSYSPKEISENGKLDNLFLSMKKQI